MMPVRKVTPSVGAREPFLILHAQVYPVERAVEIAAPRWFLARAVREGRLEHASQFLDENRAVRKHAGLEVRVQVLFLHVDVVILRETRVPVVQRVWRQ